MPVNAPLLSVILPTLNASDVLSGCLESLVPIQGRADVEILVMDGGSTDGTQAMATSFAGRLPGLRVVSEPDRGIYDAMNKGMDLARGRWLYFLGADDRWFDARRIGELLGGAGDETDILQVVSRKRTGHGDDARKITRGRLLAGEEFNHQTMFYRRAFVGDLRYVRDYPLAADQLFNLHLVAGRQAKVRHEPEVLVDYANTGVSAQRRDGWWIADKDAWIARFFSAQAVARRRRWRPCEQWVKRTVRLAAGGRASKWAVERLRDALYGTKV